MNENAQYTSPQESEKALNELLLTILKPPLLEQQKNIISVLDEKDESIQKQNRNLVESFKQNTQTIKNALDELKENIENCINAGFKKTSEEYSKLQQLLEEKTDVILESNSKILNNQKSNQDAILLQNSIMMNEFTERLMQSNTFIESLHSKSEQHSTQLKEIQTFVESIQHISWED